MANFFTDNEDLRFYVDKGIDWGPLVTITEYDFNAEDGYKDVDEATTDYRDVLEMVGQFAAEEIAPVAAEMDHIGAQMKDGEALIPGPMQEIFEQIKELDLHRMCLPRELGGMNCPMLLYFLNSEMLGRADVSTMAHHGFHGGIAMAMLWYSIQEGSAEVDVENYKLLKTRFDKEIQEIANGDAWGCMDITEPSAGSDMAALRARGEQDEDGNWFVTGEKIFITSGHGKYHFVIARTEESDPDDPFAGLKGLSMFLVPTYEDTPDGKKWIATLDRIEEKLGHHGSVTASLSYDRSPAQLVGKRGEGFKYMLTLMNNARVGVGFECLGLAEAAVRMAREYAMERPSMGKTIDRHEMIADYLDEMESDVVALRALVVHGAWHEEMAQKLELKMEFLGQGDEMERKRVAKLRKKYQAASRRVTPLIKYFGAEKAVEITRRCLQIHGGNGYITEYGAEKLLRDALVMPIYEGTSQMQALMAMKDTLGAIMKNPQGFVKDMAQARWRSVSARDPLDRRVAKIQVQVAQVKQTLITRTVAAKVKSLQGKPIGKWPTSFLKDWNPKRDFAFAMLHAERLIQMLADEAICEILLDQANRFPERQSQLERYLERAEPRCRFLQESINTTGGRLLGWLKSSEAADEAAG